MRCAGADSCTLDKRRDLRQPTGCTFPVRFIILRTVLLFGTEDPVENHVMCCVNRVRSKYHNCSRSRLAVNVGRESCLIPRFKAFDAECHLRLPVCLPGQE